MLEVASVEVSDRCSKACGFCYNRSGPAGAGRWDAGRLIALLRDGARHGLRSVSFGGGEPLEYEPLFDVLTALRPHLQRTLTTNGQRVRERLPALVAARPDKVHVSIHRPETDLPAALDAVATLEEAGIPAGVNLLVRRQGLAAARVAYGVLRAAGLTADRVVLLPMRGSAGADTPTAGELAEVAAGDRFPSVTCLSACGRSPRFVSLDAYGRAAWCSYTTSRAPVVGDRWADVLAATLGLPLVQCAVAMPSPPLTAPRGL